MAFAVKEAHSLLRRIAVGCFLYYFLWSSLLTLTHKRLLLPHLILIILRLVLILQSPLQLLLTNPAATGTIAFFDNGVSIGSPVALVAGSASLSISSLTSGSHPITAVYSGDAAFLTSTGSLTQTITAAPSATITYGSPFCKLGLLTQPVNLSGSWCIYRRHFCSHTRQAW